MGALENFLRKCRCVLNLKSIGLLFTYLFATFLRSINVTSQAGRRSIYSKFEQMLLHASKGTQWNRDLDEKYEAAYYRYRAGDSLLSIVEKYGVYLPYFVDYVPKHERSKDLVEAANFLRKHSTGKLYLERKKEVRQRIECAKAEKELMKQERERKRHEVEVARLEGMKTRIKSALRGSQSPIKSLTLDPKQRDLLDDLVSSHLVSVKHKLSPSLTVQQDEAIEMQELMWWIWESKGLVQNVKLTTVALVKVLIYPNVDAFVGLWMARNPNGQFFFRVYSDNSYGFEAFHKSIIESNFSSADGIDSMINLIF